ncbi:MAG: type VI secretion system tube protein Hcp [Aquisalimonadaceae bacterium]
MSYDSFLELDGIEGESADSQHADSIEVVSWSWGASNSGSMHEGKGGGAGKASFQDITVTKYVDKATPALWQMVATGKHVASGTLTMRKSGGDPLDYLKVELEEILVSSISNQGATGQDRLTENVTLNFAKFKLIYTPQEADGTAGAEVEYGYNIREHVAA